MAAARTLFARLGYQAAGIGDIVTLGRVTRGGLYYHFPDKRDLFEAVMRQIAEENFANIVAGVEPIVSDPWRHFVESLKLQLRRTASDAEMQQIVLIDGPAVLGWQRWNEIETEIGRGPIVAELERLMALGIVRRLDPQMTGHLILVLLNEASLSIAHAESRAFALELATASLTALVEGLYLRD